MAMIGGDNHHGLIPGAVLFNPVGDRFDSGITTEDGSNGVVDVVVMIRPVNIPGFNHQPERF